MVQVMTTSPTCPRWIYNDDITLTDIPLGAYEYMVNGKSAIEWVMERQCVKNRTRPVALSTMLTTTL